MAKKQERILIVDDEENVRRLVRSMLGEKNIVLEARDGEEAVRMARSHKPDLILMDIMMPNMDGYTACYTIKQDPVTKVIPIVMLTAVGYELNVKLSQKTGADGYITKPFRLQDLEKTIGRLLKSPE